MLLNIMVFHDFEPWLGQVYPRRNLSIVVLVVRRTIKEGDLRKALFLGQSDLTMVQNPTCPWCKMVKTIIFWNVSGTCGQSENLWLDVPGLTQIDLVGTYNGLYRAHSIITPNPPPPQKKKNVTQR
jgi:glutaredoxin